MFSTADQCQKLQKWLGEVIDHEHMGWTKVKSRSFQSLVVTNLVDLIVKHFTVSMISVNNKKILSNYK